MSREEERIEIEGKGRCYLFQVPTTGSHLKIKTPSTGVTGRVIDVNVVYGLVKRTPTSSMGFTFSPFLTFRIYILNRGQWMLVEG